MRMKTTTIHDCLQRLYGLLKTGTKQDLYNELAIHFKVSGSRARKMLTNIDNMPKDEAKQKDIYTFAFHYLERLLQSQYAPDRSRIAAIDATLDYTNALLTQGSPTTTLVHQN